MVQVSAERDAIESLVHQARQIFFREGTIDTDSRCVLRTNTSQAPLHLAGVSAGANMRSGENSRLNVVVFVDHPLEAQPGREVTRNFSAGSSAVLIEKGTQASLLRLVDDKNGKLVFERSGFMQEFQGTV
ncbi:hypothetical protein ACFL04_02960 [Patescibacteria group bacterium]